MPVINEGDTFPTLKDFKSALRDWAIEGNWTPHILDSDSHRVRAGCRSSKDCTFRIRVNFSDKRKNALVTTCDDVHNCHASRHEGAASHQNIKRAETGKLKFLMEAVPRLMKVTMGTNVQDIIDAVEKKHGQRIPTRQAQKVKSALAPRTRGLCQHCQHMGHAASHCPKLNSPMNDPPRFSINRTVGDPMDITGAEQGNDGTARGEGRLEPHLTRRDPSTEGEMEHEAQRQYFQAANKERSRGQPSLPPIDPSLSNTYQTVRVVQQSYVDRENPQASRKRPLSDSPAVPAHAPTRSPAEVRLEAAKLMQSAAILMEQAAKMHAEAARLNLSVAHA